MSEPIYAGIVSDITRIAVHAEHAWRRSHGYHDHQQQRPEGEPVTTLAELKTSADDLAAKFAAVDAAKLDKYAALDGNPVAAVLLDYPHVTGDQWAAVASLAKSYGDLVPVPQAEPEPEPEPAADDAEANAETAGDPQVQTGVAQ